MPTVPLYNMAGERVGDMELSERVFGAPVNVPLLHQAVRSYLDNQRQGTASTKTRGEVSGGGRKPWRQKGTGRARQGSIRSPLWVGGGVVFGPKPRDYGWRLPKKARRGALRAALSAKVRDGELVVLDRLEIEPKTREMAALLRRLGIAGKALVVTADGDPNVVRAARNLPGVRTQRADSLNVYEVVSQGRIVLPRRAVEVIEEVWG